MNGLNGDRKRSGSFEERVRRLPGGGGVRREAVGRLIKGSHLGDEKADKRKGK